MDRPTLAGTVLLATLFVAPAAMAQTEPLPSAPGFSPAVETCSPNVKLGPLLSSAPTAPRNKLVSPSRAAKTRFILLSAVVYGASLADMHGTLGLRNNSWWRETDPLAKPFARLPAPAYYAGGLALATGVNWLSWKMAHSKRWHKFAPIPQLISIAGNGYGIRSGFQ